MDTDNVINPYRTTDTHSLLNNFCNSVDDIYIFDRAVMEEICVLMRDISAYFKQLLQSNYKLDVEVVNKIIDIVNNVLQSDIYNDSPSPTSIYSNDSVDQQILHNSSSNQLNPSIKKPSSETNMCVVCLIHESNTIFIPCGHKCICSKCKNAKYKSCPICRKSFTGIYNVFNC